MKHIILLLSLVASFSYATKLDSDSVTQELMKN